MLGTSVPASYIAEILRRGCDVLTWLDPDAAGRRGALRYGKELRAYNIKVRDILSVRDPKLTFIEDIRRYVDGTLPTAVRDQHGVHCDAGVPATERAA